MDPGVRTNGTGPAAGDWGADLVAPFGRSNGVGGYPGARDLGWGPAASRSPRDGLAGQVWRTLRGSLWLVVLVMVLTAGSAAVVTLLQPTEYASSVTIVVRTTSRSDSETLTRTTAALLQSEALGADVRRSTGVGLTAQEIADRISVSRPPGSGVLEVTVTDTSADRSGRIAEAIAPAFVSRIEGQLGPEPDAPELAAFVQSWDAEVVTTTVTPPVAQNTAVALVLGAVLAALVVALRERFAPVLRSVPQAAAATGMPVVAAVPPLDRAKLSNRSLVDMMRALLQAGGRMGWPDAPRVILVLGTSAEERAELSLSLAATVAAGGTSVALVDADLESATLSRRLGRASAAGLWACLRGRAKLSEAVAAVGATALPNALLGARRNDAGIILLPAGTEDGGAALASPAVSDVLGGLRKSRVVIVDGPVVPGTAPVSGLLECADAVVLTLAQGSSASAAAAAADMLAAFERPAAVGVLVAADVFRIHVPRARPSPANGNGHGASAVKPAAKRASAKRTAAPRTPKRGSSAAKD